MKFPLKKSVVNFSISKTEFLDSYNDATEIPLLPHPGAFSKVRKNHQHEGIDLYCNKGDEVIAIKEGKILDIFPFTGEQVGSDHWENTWAVLVETETEIINYGELIPSKHLSIGKLIKEGELIGHVTTVLKKNKGRPMNMLHLEMYKKGTIKAIDKWDLNEDKPAQLLNPTYLVIEAALENNLFNVQQVWDNRHFSYEEKDDLIPSLKSLNKM